METQYALTERCDTFFKNKTILWLNTSFKEIRGFTTTKNEACCEQQLKLK